MLERIQIQRYKSIVKTDLTLGRLNVLIGRNGAGKSNLLNFFDLLRSGAEGRLNAAINSEMGGFSEVKQYDSADDDPLEWEITLSGVGTEPTLYYTGMLSKRGSGYKVTLEELARSPYEGYRDRFKYLSVTDGRVRILKARRATDDANTGYTDEPPSDESDQELYLSTIRTRLHYPNLFAVRQFIGDWLLFRGFGQEDLRIIRTPQPFTASQPFRLSRDGANLISILQQLANNPEYEAVNEQLNLAMSAVFDDFRKFDIPIIAAAAGVLNYRSRWYKRLIPAQSMSDGQLRFLGLLLLLLLPEPPKLILLDEPEIGMHPEMLAVFGEVIKQASERTQLIVATHSPQLLNHLGAEHVILVERDSESGITRLERPDLERLAIWLERYEVGRLWTMGRLGV